MAIRIFFIELLMKLSFSRAQTCAYFDDVTRIAGYADQDKALGGV